MKLYSVLDPEFSAYGQIVSGMEGAASALADTLRGLPLPEGVEYVPEDPRLQDHPAAAQLMERCFGGLPVQLGHCCGHNTRLNCLEYHRNSEFNLGAEDFILLLARREELENGMLDTARVRAFRVPAGVLVELYATTLHYAPCESAPRRGFRVLVALPRGTNLPAPAPEPKTPEDRFRTACNKWLLAHPDSDEVHGGAAVGLVGENIDIKDLF